MKPHIYLMSNNAIVCDPLWFDILYESCKASRFSHHEIKLCRFHILPCVNMAYLPKNLNFTVNSGGKELWGGCFAFSKIQPEPLFGKQVKYNACNAC